MSSRTEEWTCSIEGCWKPVHARGFCWNHYFRERQTGDPLTPSKRKPNVGPCSVEGCEKPARARGLCAMHYERLRTSGDVGEAEPRR